MPQRDQPLIIIQDRVFVLQLGFCVDCVVITVYSNPGCAVGKACIFPVIPLHRGSRVIPADCLQIAHHILVAFSQFLYQLMVGIE